MLEVGIGALKMLMMMAMVLGKGRGRGVPKKMENTSALVYVRIVSYMHTLLLAGVSCMRISYLNALSPAFEMSPICD